MGRIDMVAGIGSTGTSIHLLCLFVSADLPSTSHSPLYCVSKALMQMPVNAQCQGQSVPGPADRHRVQLASGLIGTGPDSLENLEFYRNPGFGTLGLEPWVWNRGPWSGLVASISISVSEPGS
jgi:hypothetical protein